MPKGRLSLFKNCRSRPIITEKNTIEAHILSDESMLSFNAEDASEKNDGVSMTADVPDL